MPRRHLLRFGIIFLLTSWFAGCTKPAASEIDFGKIDHSVYTNKFFGMQVTIPSGWSIQDQQQQQQIMTEGEKVLSGSDKNLKAMMKASELETVSLFAAFEYPQGSPVPMNPGVMALAEKVNQQPGIKTGRDYFYQARKVLEAGQLHVTFPKDYYTQKLGGVDFDVMEAQIAVGAKIVEEKYYATILKGYALSFIVVYEKDHEDPAQVKMLDSMTFK